MKQTVMNKLQRLKDLVNEYIAKREFFGIVDSLKFVLCPKHKEWYDCSKTVISKEYSTEWKPGMEPYYPVNDAANASLYEKYRQRAETIPNLIIGGRLAEYKYYDMAPTVEKVMKKFSK